MNIDKQNEARRLNGAKSKGPITEQGKRNSSRNAIRHGLLASSILMVSESDDAFREFSEELTDLYQPQNIVERSYIETMAVCRWKQERFWTLETSVLAKEERRQLAADPDLSSEDAPTRTAEAFKALADQSRSLELLGRYQTRNDREYDRALNRLRAARASQAGEKNQ